MRVGGRKIMLNMAVMCCVSLLLRFTGLSFHVWLSNRMGAQGMGLYQLICSAYALAVTLAVSGIRTAVIRLVSEERALRKSGGALKSCVYHALFFGLLSAALLYSGAQGIAKVWIGDERAALSLRMLAFALPLLALSAVMGGYFAASGVPAFGSLASVAEQAVKIPVIILIFSHSPIRDVHECCAAAVTGSLAGEAAALALHAALYLIFPQKRALSGKRAGSGARRLLSISMPLAVSAWARCALSTLEHMLIPRSLRRSGLTAPAALETYGLISGMVFPVITFPLAFYGVFAELVMPEIARAQVSGDKARIRSLADRSLKSCLVTSLALGFAFFVLARYLGTALYSSYEAGTYIRVFAPLLPVMCMDTVTDALLKGLGEHMASMRYNIADALLSVLFVLFLLPRFAIRAYTGMIWFTECFNFALSIRRLRKVLPKSGAGGIIRCNNRFPAV